jgi:hypothetical protein
MGLSQDTCGFLLEKYENGYHKFCNISKFDHDNELVNNPDIHSHTYTKKTYQQIIDEKLFDLKYDAYHKFYNHILQELLDIIDTRIKDTYNIYRLPLQNNCIKSLNQWLLENPQSFKATHGIVRTEKNKENTIESSSPIITEEYIDVYIPIHDVLPDKIRMIRLKNE